MIIVFICVTMFFIVALLQFIKQPAGGAVTQVVDLHTYKVSNLECGVFPSSLNSIFTVESLKAHCLYINRLSLKSCIPAEGIFYLKKNVLFQKTCDAHARHPVLG